MKNEREEMPPEATQGTIRNVVDEIGIIAKQGRSLAPMWMDHSGALKPSELNGYDFFLASRLSSEGEFYDPELPLALIRLYRSEDIGDREIKYKITEKEGKLRIDRYDLIRTQAEKEKGELSKGMFTQMTEGEIERFEIQMGKSLERSIRIMEEEREAGLSFVSEPEALDLLQTLKKINKKHLK